MSAATVTSEGPPHHWSLAEQAAALRGGVLSSEELTRHCLARIARGDALNSFITVTETLALDRARAADRALAEGRGGALTGVPIAHKDLFCTAGVRTTCASGMLDGFIPPYDAHAVSALAAAGTVMVGKTNMDEFAMGSSNENSHYGPVHNPWDPDLVPGGSSGGSAAAVAARLVAGATGTDTGGSVRQPAALCGITGIKPTYGRVSRHGMVAFASSMDQAGALAQSAEDCALLLGAMAGHDPRDATCATLAVPDYPATLRAPLQGMTLGLPRQYFEDEGVDPAVLAVIDEALATHRQLGVRCVPVDLPSCGYAIACYCILAMAECSANLSRYDGVRYGRRSPSATSLGQLYTRSRAEGFGDEVKRRVMMGAYALSAGYYDAYYRRAQRVRRMLRDEWLSVLSAVDAIVAPTTPYAKFKLGERIADPVQMYKSDLCTIPANLGGLPAISYPVGMAGENCPVGMQLIGGHWQEARLLNVAHQYQQASDWHRRIPPGCA